MTYMYLKTAMILQSVEFSFLRLFIRLDFW